MIYSDQEKREVVFEILTNAAEPLFCQRGKLRKVVSNLIGVGDYKLTEHQEDVLQGMTIEEWNRIKYIKK